MYICTCYCFTGKKIILSSIITYICRVVIIPRKLHFHDEKTSKLYALDPKYFILPHKNHQSYLETRKREMCHFGILMK